jgi:hypothetical protein
MAQSSPLVAPELLGRPTDNSVTINAVASSATEVYAEYGLNPGAYVASTTPSVFAADSTIQIVLAGLQSDARYFYRLRYRAAGSIALFDVGAEHFFHTHRPRGSTFTFDIHADPHLDTASDTNCYRNALALTLKDEPDFMIDLGDNFMCEKLIAPTRAACESRITLLRSFYQRTCHSVPLYLVQGNHEGEYGTLNDGTAECLPVWVANLRKKYFFNPHPDGFYTGDTTVQPFIGPRDSYYAFEWGDALFVVLDPYWYTRMQNANDDKQWNFTLGDLQYRWFKATIEKSTAKFKFVFCHHLVGGAGGKGLGRGGVEWVPFYEQGGENLDSTWGFTTHRSGWDKSIHQLMVDNHVNAFFHGHDHIYVRQELDGVIYQECPQPSLPNYTSVRVAADYGYVQGDIRPNSGYLRVTVSPDSASVEYVRAYAADDAQKGYKNGTVDVRYAIMARPAAIQQQHSPATLLYRAALPGCVIRLSRSGMGLTLATSERVTVSLVDMAGRSVATLMDGPLAAGRHALPWGPGRASVANGLHFVKVTTPAGHRTVPVTLF